jgi:hypothetical protein
VPPRAAAESRDDDDVLMAASPGKSSREVGPTATWTEERLVGRTSRSSATMRDRAPDRGMQVLEEKLSILTRGPSRTRRNPALDVLTGRVPDERLQSLQASLMSRPAPGPGAATTPTAMVLPVAAVRMAAVARTTRPAPSPWLQAGSDTQPRLRLISPPPSRWMRIPWLGRLVLRLRAEYRPYKWTGHSPRAHLAS